MKKKICFITTCRADYGYIEELLNEASKKLSKSNLYLIISGNHFSNFFGNSSKLVKKFKNIKKINISLPDLNKNIDSTVKIFNYATIKFVNALKKIKPDLVITFGDRFEMFAFSFSCYTQNIKQAHLAGGEITSGSLDNGFRNSITNFSNYHFPVTETYKKNLIKSGIKPKNIFNYGNLGFDKIKKLTFFSKESLEKKLNIKFKKKTLVVVFHPETSEIANTLNNLKVLLSAIKNFKNVSFIFTSPGSDYLGKQFVNEILKIVKKKQNMYFFKNLGSETYLSLLKNSAGIIGNSSSGISEAPMLNIPTINIGNRQKGRVSLKSIYNCNVNIVEIKKNIKKILNNKKNYNISKIYGDGKAATKIVNKIKNLIKS